MHATWQLRRANARQAAANDISGCALMVFRQHDKKKKERKKERERRKKEGKRERRKKQEKNTTSCILLVLLVVLALTAGAGEMAGCNGDGRRGSGARGRVGTRRPRDRCPENFENFPNFQNTFAQRNAERQVVRLQTGSTAAWALQMTSKHALRPFVSS